MKEKDRVERAVDCFNNGFNCAQAVLSSYCEEFGLDKTTALKLSCGLGAGMGRLGNVCGAVAAAYLVIGLKYGQSLPKDKDAKEKTYTMVRAFAAKFEQRNKTTMCSELLGLDLLSGDQGVVLEKVRATCPQMVRDAAEILEEIL